MASAADISAALRSLVKYLDALATAGCRWLWRVRFFRGSVMMGRTPRVPVDFQAVTRDTKARVRRVIGNLEAIEQQQDPIFTSPRDVFLELVLSIHELEAAAAKMRKAWWPPP